MVMNKQSALKILGLKKGACLGDAKKAYRNLAKQYHPDKFGTDPFTMNDKRENKLSSHLTQMKMINQAFHFLEPLLPSEKVYSEKEPSGKRPPPKKSYNFLDIIRAVKERLFSKIPGAFVRQRPSVKPCIKNPVLQKQMASQRKRPGRKQSPDPSARFDKILNIAYPGLPAGVKNKKNRGQLSQERPHANFLKHMAVKKRITARTRRHGELNCGRVEQIQPITRVNPIGKE